MDLKEQIIQEYLTQGSGFRKLSEKYGMSRTTICKWVAIYQGIHNLPPSEKQLKYATAAMNSSPKKPDVTNQQQSSSEEVLQQRIAALEKQLQWEKLRVEALDTMINIAEKDLNISIRKKPGAQQ